MEPNAEAVMSYNRLVFNYIDMAITRGHIPKATRAELTSARLLSGMIDNHLSACGIEPKSVKPGPAEIGHEEKVEKK